MVYVLRAQGILCGRSYINIRKGIAHECIFGLMIPFVGTTLGAACVLFMKKELNPLVQKAFLGFASGVMVAASVWSLLIPAMDMSGSMGKFAFIPAAAGLLLGVGFLLVMDKAVPHLHLGSEESEGPKVALKNNNACPCGNSSQYSGRAVCRSGICRCAGRK